MFENTLLVVKSDYMTRRKCLVLHLLSKGFQIQARRKLVFKPEDAAEFYKDLENDKCYMLYVILLSKGTSEAIVVTKQNAAQELVEVLICFFGTSMEMDRNVHVSRNAIAARREISFIFPNYIHEPFDFFDKHKFVKEPVLEPLLRETCNIIKKRSENDNDDWRVQLSDWLLKKNANYPRISNQCSYNLFLALQEKSQQTEAVASKHRDGHKHHKKEKDVQRDVCSSSSVLTGATSDLMSSSSCVSCSSFKSGEGFTEKQQLIEFEKRLKLRATRTIPDECPQMKDAEKTVCEDIVVFVSTSTSEELIKEQKLTKPTGDDLEVLSLIECCYGKDAIGTPPKDEEYCEVLSLVSGCCLNEDDQDGTIKQTEDVNLGKAHSKDEVMSLKESKTPPIVVEAEKEVAVVEEPQPEPVAEENVVETIEPVEVPPGEPAPEPAEPEVAPEEIKAAEV